MMPPVTLTPTTTPHPPVVPVLAHLCNEDARPPARGLLKAPDSLLHLAHFHISVQARLCVTRAAHQPGRAPSRQAVATAAGQLKRGGQHWGGGEVSVPQAFREVVVAHTHAHPHGVLCQHGPSDRAQGSGDGCCCRATWKQGVPSGGAATLLAPLCVWLKC